MRKAIYGILTFVLFVLAFCACKSAKPENNESKPIPTSVTTVAESIPGTKENSSAVFSDGTVTTHVPDIGDITATASRKGENSSQASLSSAASAMSQQQSSTNAINNSTSSALQSEADSYIPGYY